VDVDAFYRGELLIDDDAVRAGCTGGPIEQVSDIYVFSPGAVWPAGWELEHRTVELCEPVAHPRDPSRTLSVLPVAPGVRPELVDALLTTDAQLSGILSLHAPASVIAGTRELVRQLVGGLFGIVAAPVPAPPREEPAYDTATIAGAFCAALARVDHPEVTARGGGYDDAMEMLAIELELRHGGLPWLSDTAFLHASPAVFETAPTDDVARYAALYVEDLAAHVAAYRARYGDARPVQRIAEGFPPTFPALDLLERLASDGAFEPSDLEAIFIPRLTPIAVPKLPKKQALYLARVTVFAAFAAGDAVIVLGDSPTDRPFSEAFVGVIRNGSLIPILVSDPAGGLSRALDGDPYRLRLVTAALRDAVRAGHHEAAVLAPLAMPIDRWLAFGLPEIGDRLVDPDQWYVVEADDPIDEGDLYDGADPEALRAAYHAWFESLSPR
jgi:hypothetical protein